MFCRFRAKPGSDSVAADAVLDLLLDQLYAPLTRRWPLLSGTLDTDFADSLVESALRAFRPS